MDENLFVFLQLNILCYCVVTVTLTQNEFLIYKNVLIPKKNYFFGQTFSFNKHVECSMWYLFQ